MRHLRLLQLHINISINIDKINNRPENINIPPITPCGTDISVPAVPNNANITGNPQHTKCIPTLAAIHESTHFCILFISLSFLFNLGDFPPR